MKIFNQIQVNKERTNTFDLSHDRKMSFKMGKLTPMLVQEVIPGDTFNLQSEQLIRLAPMVAPMMHKVNVYTHYFFVPNRIIWSNWERFITNDDSNPVMPQIEVSPENNPVGGLLDHLGYPQVTGNELRTYSAFPLAAYHKIYDEFYRDQNLIPETYQPLEDSRNPYYEQIGITQLKNRAWEHDYFTSALPFAQKGDSKLNSGSITNGASKTRNQAGSLVNATNISSGTGILGNIQGNTNSSLPSFRENLQIDVTAHTEVDLSEATASTINDLRRAFKLQEWLERNARAGTRYVETLLSHFGVKGGDDRLQRPEYLGGGKSALAISEVLQTAQSEDTPTGTLAGHGINVGQSNNFNKSFEEHGFIIGIISVMPKPSYVNTTPRHLIKFDKFDYAFPSFATLGEQEVFAEELDGQHTRGTLFGYMPRYAEYKTNHDTVNGDFRTNLDHWHMARKFNPNALPLLNKDFIECRPDERIFAITDNTDKIWCHIHHRIKARRMLPLFGTPTL